MHRWRHSGGAPPSTGQRTGNGVQVRKSRRASASDEHHRRYLGGAALTVPLRASGRRELLRYTFRANQAWH